jgi:hypothetical protein
LQATARPKATKYGSAGKTVCFQAEYADGIPHEGGGIDKPRGYFVFGKLNDRTETEKLAPRTYADILDDWFETRPWELRLSLWTDVIRSFKKLSDEQLYCLAIKLFGQRIIRCIKFRSQLGHSPVEHFVRSQNVSKLSPFFHMVHLVWILFSKVKTEEIQASALKMTDFFAINFGDDFKFKDDKLVRDIFEKSHLFWKMQ